MESACTLKDLQFVLVDDNKDNSTSQMVNTNATSFERHDGVVIVTNVLLWQNDLSKLMEWACLISHAYNDKMHYGLVVFTTTKWDDDNID